MPSSSRAQSSPTRSPAAAAPSAAEPTRRSDSRKLPPQKRARTRLELERDVDLVLRHESGRPLEQVDRSAEVLPRYCPAAGGGEAASRRLRQLGVAGQRELLAIAPSLLEVVRQDLLEFDEVTASLLEPCREAPMQVGAGCLRQAGVGSVADQQVAEAEAVLARK
jgi:hypothetical protein